MKKNLCYLILIFILSGCATYERRVTFVPQKTSMWKEISPKYFRFSCSQGEVVVSPLVFSVKEMGSMFLFIPISENKESLELANQEDPWMNVRFSSKNHIESCNLSFILLEDQQTRNRVYPFKVESLRINDASAGIHIADCRYFFKIEKIPQSKYILHISKEVFNCDFEPIPYVYEEACYTWPVQLM